MIRQNLKYLAVLAAAAALGSAAQVSSGGGEPDWKIAGPFGGTATTIAVDSQAPKTLLVGALNTELFRSDDYGKSWTLLDFPQRHLGEITSALIDPVDPTHYLAGVVDAFGGALFESHDSGKTWTVVPDMRDFGVKSLALSKSNTAEIVAGTMHGVMLSTDSGKSWKRISDPNNLEMQGITAVAVDPQDANVIYAGTSHLPWKTMDGGKTWESIHSGMIDDSDVFSIYVDPQQPNDVYASACSGIYASQDRGELWKKIAGIPNTSRRTHVIRVDPVKPGTIYAGTTTGLFESPNGGTTWHTLTNTQVNSIAFDPTQPRDMYFAMLGEGVGRSDDGGQSIQPSNDGFVDRYITSVTVLGSKIVAIEGQEGESTGIFISPDGSSWSQVREARGLAGVHLRTVAGSAENDHILMASNPHSIYKSVDAGVTWRPMSLRVVTQPADIVRKTKTKSGHTVTRTIHPKAVIHTMTPTDVAGVWTVHGADKDATFAASNLGLFKSVDWGEQWTAVELPGAVTVTDLFTAPGKGTPVVLRTNAGLLITRDGGEKWDRLDFPQPVSDVYDVAVSAAPTDPILIATRTGLYSSTDGGQNWVANAGGIPASTVSAVTLIGGDTAYAVEYGQLYRSDDAGKHWRPTHTRLQGLQIRQLWNPGTNNRLYAISPGLGILFRD